jgi:hypothetical protein
MCSPLGPFFLKNTQFSLIDKQLFFQQLLTSMLAREMFKNHITSVVAMFGN